MRTQKTNGCLAATNPAKKVYLGFATIATNLVILLFFKYSPYY